MSEEFLIRLEASLFEKIEWQLEHKINKKINKVQLSFNKKIREIEILVEELKREMKRNDSPAYQSSGFDD